MRCLRRCPCPPQIDYLTSLGLGQDEVCNMASISVVLLGLNPDTRLAPVVDYLKRRGVPADQVCCATGVNLVSCTTGLVAAAAGAADGDHKQMH
jgi:hypothetical protein